MEQKKWFTYWKKSLSDSLAADIDIEKLQHFEIEHFQIESQSTGQLYQVNRLIDFEEERINKKKGISNKDNENWKKLESIQVIISPFKIVPTPEHLVFLRDRRNKFPFWYYAILNRQGRLSVPEDFFPVFQRKFLEPLADEKTEFIFTTVEKVDKATSTGKEAYESFEEYINYVKTVFNAAVDQSISNYKTEGFDIVQNGVILLPNEDINAAIGIIHLYEKILNKTTPSGLLLNLISLKNDIANNPLSISQLIEADSFHVGQMGFNFPLSMSQRKSLYTFLQTDSKVFAVNGPPGTGKTTLLQSVVANKIVESAIKGSDPIIILACSTNNQAVTNIIDSFSHSNTRTGTLQGRWLPDIDGYATYLPASGKTEAELNGINYKKLSGEGIFNMVENHNYVINAKEYFLQKSSIHFNSISLSIDATVKKLQSEIVNIQDSLKMASKRWKEYIREEEAFLVSYCTEKTDESKYYLNTILNEKFFETDITDLMHLEQRVISFYKNESTFRKLFCFLGIKRSLQKRADEIRIILRDSLIQETNNFHFSRSVILQLINDKITSAKAIIKAIIEWKAWKQRNSITGNPPKTEEEYEVFENIKMDGSRRKDLKLSQPNCFYDELDVTLRHKAFQLALHYWKGRWLLKFEQDFISPIFNGKNEEKNKNRWIRQAMLTPCFVSTFYMAPKFFNYSKFLLNSDNGNPIFDYPPLFEFIDLLIVDEAGQVSPEVGIATFSLAKRAIVVGDTKQIEPVWNITNKIDVGNLKREGLIKNYDDLIYEKEFDPKGFLASTGSIMKMAQNACIYKEDKSIEKGLTLTEHRRCYDEIINYCNVLAYNRQLKPCRGQADKTNLFPPMCCIHVEGNSTITNTSRYNSNEVTAIINWLKTNKSRIENKYGKIESVVGIITPFVGQKNNLRYALNKAGFDTSLMKFGTIHALQGAERPIILFSMVYGKGDSGTMFFDRDNKPNMLNVAVSRAKDSFIVFANTQILDKKMKTPSGILANYLTYG